MVSIKLAETAYQGTMITERKEASTCEMKAPWTDPGLRELLALAALAALGCGLALAQGEFFFGAIFAAASALIIVEALRRFR